MQPGNQTPPLHMPIPLRIHPLHRTQKTTTAHTMTCDCSDPIVFGHNCYTYETPRTYAAGETFTTTPETIINAISHAHLPPMSFSPGGVIMPAREAGHAIRNATMQGHHGGYVTFDEATAYLTDPNDPIGNWLEIGQTHPFRIELWGTS